MRRSVFAGLPLCLSLLGCAASPQPAVDATGTGLPDFAALGDQFDDIRIRADVPGASIAVLADDQIAWSAAFGFADLEHGVPVTARTKFRIGSASKPMTATVLGRLVERGVVSLEDEVHDWLPDYPETGRGITLGMLASNQSGVRHYREDEFLIGDKIWWQHYPTTQSALSIFSDDPLVQPPGEGFHYSTYGWTLLAAVLEAASGQDFPSLLQAEVFDRLDLDDTVIDHHFTIIPDRTRFYWHAPTGELANAPFTENSYKYAGGGILSTSEDLAAFGNAWIDGEAVSLPLRDVMVTPQVSVAGEATSYGFGWFVGLKETAERFTAADEPVPPALRAIEEAGVRVFEHRGGQIGASTVLWVFPDQDLVVTASWNLSGQGRRLYEASLLVACKTLSARPGLGPLECED